MTITRIRPYKTGLPYVRGAYVWGAGNAILGGAIFGARILAVLKIADLGYEKASVTLGAAPFLTLLVLLLWG